MRTAFLFPGQGAQALGMGVELSEKSPAAKALFDQAAEILNYDLLQVCRQGPIELLNATNVSQPAIFVTSLAALEHLKHTEADVLSSVTATAGLSLGEYTALVFAGAMTFADGLRVVKARGEAMQAAAEATPSGMVAIIGLEAAEIEPIVADASKAGLVKIANYLCPGNTVVSGSAAAIDEVCRIAEANQLRVARLAVAGAFHTELMQPADAKLAEVLATVKLNTPTIPVWSNVDAQPHSDPSELAPLLVRQVLSPVLWEATMRNMLADGVERFYEIGPGRVLAGLLKRVNRKLNVVNIAG